jgi:fatty acid desaturase
MDRGRWNRLRERYRVLMREYRKSGKEVAEEYRAAMPELTSRSFWEQYLAERA